MGDLGTLLPLLLALTLTGSINLPTTLVFTGLANILTGLFFEIPLPVQPMKAIAAVAIANRFSVTETTSAGIFVGASIFFAGVTGILGWIGRVVPVPVVKGIQVGAGITLAISGGGMIQQTHDWGSKVIAALVFLLFVTSTRPVPFGAGGIPRVPFALLVTVVGVVAGIFEGAVDWHALPFFFGIWKPSVSIPTGKDFSTGVLEAGIGQLPLTTLNSVIAVNYLCTELLPSPPYPKAPSFRALGISVGVANLVACWFGAMPVCHGSGGLAGQFKFGARSGASIVFLGLIKLVLGLFVSGDWMVEVLKGFPKSLLGVMVIVAGLELARVGEGVNTNAKDLVLEQEIERGEDGTITNGESNRKSYRELDDREKTERWYVMLVTAALLLAFKNDAVGFIAGLLTHWSIKAPEHWRRWRDGRGTNEERARLLHP